MLALRAVNLDLPHTALENAVYKLKNFESGSLLQKNMVFTDYLQNGVPVKFVVQGEDRPSLVYLVDYQRPERNQFTAVNQWTVIENSEKRADVVLFVNGLPLVVVDLKSPFREETDASTAYRQLRNYMYEIPSLFIYNQVCIMSDLTISKAGTITPEKTASWRGTPRMAATKISSTPSSAPSLRASSRKSGSWTFYWTSSASMWMG